MLRRVRKDHCAFIHNEAHDGSLSVVAALDRSGVTDADEAVVRKQHLPVLQRVNHRIETMLSEFPDLVASLMTSDATRLGSRKG